jgi:uncharacterized protein YukJ
MYKGLSSQVNNHQKIHSNDSKENHLMLTTSNNISLAIDIGTSTDTVYYSLIANNDAIVTNIKAFMTNNSLKFGTYDLTTVRSGLDYVRDDFIVNHIKNVYPLKSNSDNSLTNFLISQAQAGTSVIAFGKYYSSGGKGIHDIHMNQLNSNSNSEGQDGAIFFYNKSTNQITGALMMFQSQKNNYLK